MVEKKDPRTAAAAANPINNPGFGASGMPAGLTM
jgi:hypothetical protein